MMKKHCMVFSTDLIGHISKGQVCERHASVAPQRDAVMVAAQPEHLTIDLQQLCNRLQTAYSEKTVRVTVSKPVCQP